MESSVTLLHTRPFTSSSLTRTNIHHTRFYKNQHAHISMTSPKKGLPLASIPAALKSPRGFGTPPKRKKTKKGSNKGEEISEEEDDDDDEEESEGVIPEIVTNRMMSRMGVSVGAPLFIGLLFFPFFYYLKVGLKIDVPTWVPFIVSFIFFGSALLGVSYGIVSSSWDPMREGSFLGWNEAKRNWPVFWQSIWGRSGKK